jgi:hypothetical protein
MQEIDRHKHPKASHVLGYEVWNMSHTKRFIEMLASHFTEGEAFDSYLPVLILAISILRDVVVIDPNTLPTRYS